MGASEKSAVEKAKRGAIERDDSVTGDSWDADIRAALAAAAPDIRIIELATARLTETLANVEADREMALHQRDEYRDETARLTETLDRVRALAEWRLNRSSVIGARELLHILDGPAPVDPDERAGDGQ